MGPYHIAHPRPNKPTRVMAPGSSFSSGYQLHVSRYLYGVVNGFRVYEDTSHIIPSSDTSREAFSDAAGLILSTMRMWSMILIDDVELIGSLTRGSSILEITTICYDANIDRLWIIKDMRFFYNWKTFTIFPFSNNSTKFRKSSFLCWYFFEVIY